MTDDQAGRILSEIRGIRSDVKELDTKHDRTREELASVVTSTKNLVGWAEKLDGRLDTVTQTAAETRANQNSCIARKAAEARNTAEATGNRATLPDGMAVQILHAHDTDPPPVKIAKWKAIAALGVGIPAIGGLGVAVVELVRMIFAP